MMMKLENVRYRYAGNLPYIIDGASYEFRGGKIYAVTGESGSGKTTLISLIAGLDKPTEGIIYYDGRNISEINEDIYRSRMVSVIYQSYNLLYNYSALENITLMLSLIGYKENKAVRADSILEKVGIQAEKRSYPVQNLSGGEQQRVAIARALSSESQMILADEPTGNLDENNAEKVLDLLISSAHETNKCVIIVTHSTAYADKCDVNLKMANGKIEQKST